MHAAALPPARTPLEALLEVAGDVCVHLDAQGRISFCSRSAAQGALVEHLGPGCSFLELFAPDDRDEVLQRLRQAVPGERFSLRRPLQPKELSRYEFTLCAYDAYSRRGIVAVALERTRTAESAPPAIRHLDPLTGLLDRTGLQAAVRDLLEREAGALGFSLVTISLRGFKRVNDTLGPAKADALLRSAAERLRAALRSSDVVARVGSDEFSALLLGVQAADVAQSVLRKLAVELELPFFVEGSNVRVGASLGCATYPAHGSTFEALFSSAAKALDEARTRGSGTVVVFEDNLAQARQQQLSLESALHEGLRDGEFYLDYQPLVLADGSLYGAEALMRWSHRGQLVSPARFIPLAEDNGLIHLLGAWVLKVSCLEMARLSRRLGRPLTVSVNVSPRQFRGPEFLRSVREALHLSGLEPSQLQLEITEGTLMHSPQGAAHMLEQLAQQGVRVAVDDFGTGYSSLAYLKQFRLSALKIDRTFVKDLPSSRADLAICRSVFSLARDLGIRSVAEGVETQEQYDLLRESGCDAFQGYYFGRPRPLRELEAVAQPPRCEVL